MIYPKPYSLGGGDKIILGRSSKYNIDHAEIDSNFSNGYAKEVSMKANNEINLIFGDLGNANQVERYQYVLLPTSQKWEDYYWQRDIIGNGDGKYHPIIPWYSNQNYGLLYNQKTQLTQYGFINTHGLRMPTVDDFESLADNLGGVGQIGRILKGTNLAPNPSPRWGYRPENYLVEDPLGFRLYGGGWRNQQPNFNGFANFEYHLWFLLTDEDDNWYKGWINYGNTDYMRMDINNVYDGCLVRYVSTSFAPEDYPNDGYISSVTDLDGNVYPTKRIGDRVWMLQNFAATQTQSGDRLYFHQDRVEWVYSPMPKYCYYNPTGQAPWNMFAWWVKIRNFLYKQKSYTMYKLKTVGIGPPSPIPAWNVQWKKYDLSDGALGNSDPLYPITVPFVEDEWNPQT